MTVVVFTGPTICPDEARAQLDAVYLPPVGEGDVYRAALQRPRAIGIIDGFFERVPAVWHKEILWAMSQGIHVYGSASMGALRAAELAVFGMEGVGLIFEAYRDGRLEDDDEVAVVHGPAECGYRALSEAMVNIRYTLAAAEGTGLISPATGLALTCIAKGLFYPERAYPLVLRRGAEQGISEDELARLREWLPRGQVNQKRDDALAMLQLMRRRLAGPPEAKQVRYRFEYTEMWDYVRRFGGSLGAEPGPARPALERLLDELRLEGAGHYLTVCEAALLRSLALEEAHRYGLTASAEALQEAVSGFRQQRALTEAAALEQWLRANDLGPDEFARLMEDEARLRWLGALAQREVASQLPDQLRVSGHYARLLARARAKQQVLDARGLPEPDLAATGLSEEDLWRWYFETRLGRSVVADVGGYACAMGFPDAHAFRRAIVREFCYLRAPSP
jgi:hypothetical protein